jgi:hypothetical protein
MLVFIERPISAVFVGLCVVLIGSQVYLRLKGAKVAELNVDADTTTGASDDRKIPAQLAGQRVPVTPAE